MRSGDAPCTKKISTSVWSCTKAIVGIVVGVGCQLEVVPDITKGRPISRGLYNNWSFLSILSWIHGSTTEGDHSTVYLNG